MNPIPTITTLGEPRTTFAWQAAEVFAKMFGSPSVILGENSNCISVGKNDHILQTLKMHGGYAVIPMETRAECSVEESVKPFGKLILDQNDPSFVIIGAIRMKVSFCLMARKGNTSIKKIMTHTKGDGVCKGHILARGFSVELVGNNGEGPRRIANDPEYAEYGALAPASAAEVYGLDILEREFEDKEAITTFFLLGPDEHPVPTGKDNRAVVISTTPKNVAGSKYDAMAAFKVFQISLRNTASVAVGEESEYSFYDEVQVSEDQLDDFSCAIKGMRKWTQRMIVFGPFPIVSV